MSRKTGCFLGAVACLLASVAQPLMAQRGSRSLAAGSAAGVSRGEVNSSAKAFLDAAVTALNGNDLPRAEQNARAAVATVPRSATAHNILGVILDQESHGNEAAVEFRTAIKLEPDFAGAHNNLGRVLAQQGKTEAAIAEFERVLKIDPSHQQAHYNLGALYGDAGDFVRSAEHFARARAGAPNDPQFALAFLSVAYRANRTAEANQAADLVEHSESDNPRGLFTLAIALAQNEQYERAINLFQRVNAAIPHTFEVLYNLGVALYNLDRNNEAATALAEAADLNPGPAETHFRLGLIAVARKDHANAAIEFRHAVERDQKNPNYFYLLGREYFEMGYWDGAIDAYTHAMGLDPKHEAYVLGRANANLRKGEGIAAAADFDAAAALDPRVENIAYWQGYSHRVAGDFDRARGYFEKYLASHPDDVDTLSNLGFIAVEQGRFDDAEQVLQRALKLSPGGISALYDYARVAMKRRNYQEASDRLKRVIEADQGHTQAHYQLFLAYSRLKEQQQAQNELSEFKRLEALDKQAKQERQLDDKLRAQTALGQAQ